MVADKSGIFKTVRRIIAIGDLHGDYQATLNSLQLAKVIKLNGTRWTWCGGKTHVIQVGDQIDRKCREDVKGGDEDSEIKIMKLLDYLDGQAIRDGGRILSLVGNHELLSCRGQFQYVSPKGLAHFGGEEKRHEAFRPGGEMAKYMAEHRYAVVKIGAFMFVHAGITPKIADKYTIPQINQKCRDYLAGKLAWNSELNELFESNDGILWTRHLGGPRPNCEKLDHVLNKWNARAMVIGHTPQEDGITSACDHKIWRVDVGLSAAILGSKGKADRVQVLEICNSPSKQASIKILRSSRDDNSVQVVTEQIPKAVGPSGGAMKRTSHSSPVKKARPQSMTSPSPSGQSRQPQKSVASRPRDKHPPDNVTVANRPVAKHPSQSIHHKGHLRTPLDGNTVSKKPKSQPFAR